MTNDLQEFIEEFYRITNLIQQTRLQKISFDGTPTLQTASIHFIEMIGKHEDANMTKLAEMLDITKGAVSQMAKKLEDKGLISRSHSGDNDKDTFFHLTQDGWKVFNGHEKLHGEMYGEIESILAELSEDDLQKAKKIFEKIEACMKEYQHGI